jgi:MOSC domain-containing protein YiiM
MGAMDDSPDATPPTGLVEAVSSSAQHGFSKPNRPEIRVVAGVGVEGDVHAGASVQHRPRRADPRPNLRQVHLMHAELFDELAAKGFAVTPGALGENLTTRGVALLTLPRGTRLHIGDAVVLELTGLRNPCTQIDGLQDGLMRAVLDRDADGTLIRKTGVMSIALSTGLVRPGDAVGVELPSGRREALTPV